MLILKVCRDESFKQKKKLFFKKSKNDTKTAERKSIKLNNGIYTYIKTYDVFLDDYEMTRLFNRFKGQVLFCNKELIGDSFSEYSFDYKPYFKRAVLSALNKQIVTNVNKYSSICISTECFVFNREVTELAKNIKRMILLTSESVYTQEFCDYCYYNFGAVVNIIDKKEESEYDMYIDLDSIDESGKTILEIHEKEMILYPDPAYFNGNEDVELLVSIGVPLKIACAALQVKKDVPITWRVNR